MKKMFFTIALAGIVLGLSSCAADYDCNCTYNDGTGSDTTVTVTYPDVSKKDATDACEAVELAWKITDPTAVCTLTKN